MFLSTFRRKQNPTLALSVSGLRKSRNTWDFLPKHCNREQRNIIYRLYILLTDILWQYYRHLTGSQHRAIYKDAIEEREETGSCDPSVQWRRSWLASEESGARREWRLTEVEGCGQAGLGRSDRRKGLISTHAAAKQSHWYWKWYAYGESESFYADTDSDSNIQIRELRWGWEGCTHHSTYCSTATDSTNRKLLRIIQRKYILSHKSLLKPIPSGKGRYFLTPIPPFSFARKTNNYICRFHIQTFNFKPNGSCPDDPKGCDSYLHWDWSWAVWRIRVRGSLQGTQAGRTVLTWQFRRSSEPIVTTSLNR